MNRIYLKQTKNKLMTTAKKLDADYVEGDNIILKCPKKTLGGIRLAYRIKENSKYGWDINLGTIDSSCDNFKSSSTCFIGFDEELDWAVKTLTKIKQHLKFKRVEITD